MTASFQTASRFLERLAVPSFPHAHNRLVCLDRVANILDAFRQCFPDKNPVTDRLTLHDLDDGRLLAIQKAAITAAAGLFPLQEDYMETLVEEGEPLQLHPDFCGFAWDDEWLSEVLQNPAELSPECDLAMFFKVLWLITSQFGQEDGQRLWEDARGHFGYPCDCPQVGENVRARDFNWQAFYDLLEAHNLGGFRRALDVALCDTGNLFLDTSPDDYGYGLIEIPDFSAHNVLELQRLWQEAEGWLADYQACRTLVLDDPGLYIRLVELWEQVCRSQPRTNRPKTLCEIFGEGTDDVPNSPLR